MLELSKAIVFLTKFDQIASSSPLQLSRLSVADKKRNRVPSSRSGKIPSSGKIDAKDSDSDAQDPGSFCLQNQKVAVVGLMQRCYTSFSDQIKDLGDTHTDRNAYVGGAAAAAAAAAAMVASTVNGNGDDKENNDNSNVGDAQNSANGANRADFGGIRSVGENSTGARAGGHDVWEAVGAALEYREGIAEQKLRAAYESLAMTLCVSLTSILLWHTQVCVHVYILM